METLTYKEFCKAVDDVIVAEYNLLVSNYGYSKDDASRRACSVGMIEAESLERNFTIEEPTVNTDYTTTMPWQEE